MSTDPIHVERRASQRFEFHLPVSIRVTATGREGSGCTQDLSRRGAFFYTDFPLVQGDAVELTLVMPSEITLAKNMRVCCRGKVSRVGKAVAENKSGVAVHIEEYEFLPDVAAVDEASASFARISALHEHKLEEQVAVRPNRTSEQP